MYPGPRETEAREDQKDLATSWIRFLSSDRRGDKANQVILIDPITDTAAILIFPPGHPIILDWFYYCDNEALSLQKNK